MKSLVSHEGRHCANCGTPLVGEYCHECGQSVHSVLKPMHHMIEETVETVLHVDSRILDTLPPLFLKPGFLTLEYFAGRRVRYIAPFRLMFVLCLLSFFVLHLATSEAISHSIEQRQHHALLDRGADFAQAGSAAEVRELLDEKDNALNAVQTFGDDAMAAQASAAKQRLRTAANQRLAELHAQPLPPEYATAAPITRTETSKPVQIAWLPDFANQRLNAIRQRVLENWHAFRHGDAVSREAAKDRVVNGIFGNLPGAMLVLVPIYALLLKLFYVFKRRLYMEHLIVVLHSQAFLFLWLLLCMLLCMLLGMFANWLKPHALWATSPLNWLEWALVLWAPIYLLLTQKRIYRQGWPMTLLKYWCVGWSYFWLLGFVLLFAFVLGLAH
jgi:hypothetical protein